MSRALNYATVNLQNREQYLVFDFLLVSSMLTLTPTALSLDTHGLHVFY